MGGRIVGRQMGVGWKEGCEGELWLKYKIKFKKEKKITAAAHGKYTLLKGLTSIFENVAPGTHGAPEKGVPSAFCT